MRPLFLLLSPKQEAMESLLACTYHTTSLSSKGKDWVQCTGELDPLRSWHVSSFFQFLYMCQNLNGSSALWIGFSAQEHWTHWDFDTCTNTGQNWTCVKISTCPVLLYTGPNPFPLKGSDLGLVHKSTGPIEILTHVQKLDTCQNLNGSSAPVHWTQRGASWV